MSRHSTAIPVGRIRRGAKVGGLLGLEAARAYASKAANVARSDQGKRAVSERRRLDAAEHLAEARLHDGRRVAVKVQYPGVDAAVRADLQNLGLMMLPAKRLAPGLDAAAMAAETRERTTEELDVSRLLRDAGDPRSDCWDVMRNETIPADSLFSNRMQGMTLAVIGQLRATANWHRVMSEWLYGLAPSSPLGHAEADFFGLRTPAREAA